MATNDRIANQQRTIMPTGVVTVPQQRTAPGQRLTVALARRDELGAEYMHRLSHGFDAEEQLYQLALQEVSIGESWAAVLNKKVDDWAMRDARLLHDPGSGPQPGCPYCEGNRSAADPPETNPRGDGAVPAPPPLSKCLGRGSPSWIGGDRHTPEQCSRRPGRP